MFRTTLVQATQYVLQKNHLVQPYAGRLETLTGQLAGLPGSPVTTPVLAARARQSAVVPGDVAGAALITSLLMRSSLYQVPQTPFLDWYAATGRQRNQSLNAELRLWGIETNAEVERLGGEILDVIDRQPATVEEITDRIPAVLVRELNQTSRGGRVSTTTSVALALRWLVSSGQLVILNTASDWWVERLAYQRLDWTYPELDLANLPAEAEAQKGLVRAFIAGFGPVTEADISFWTGFGKSETARATGALANETVLTMVEGIPGMLLMLKEQTDALRTIEPLSVPLISILPANDPYLTAYRASRSRYFSDQTLQRRVFSSSGVAKPAILVNGKIVGIWDWKIEEDRHRLGWKLLAPVDPAVETLIRVEVERVAAFIGPQTIAEAHDSALGEK